MGKKLFRTSALSVQNTPQKDLKHGGAVKIIGGESHQRRIDLLKYAY